MKTLKLITISLILGSAIYFLSSINNSAQAQTSIDAGYNPNNIISDTEMLDVYSMSLSDIQAFLQSKGSYLANLQIPNAYGDLKTASEIIYNAVRNNYDCTGATLSDSPTETERLLKCRLITTINPKVLLVLLQKEQSLIQNPAPTQKALDEATGYGCPTGQSCNPYWKGFGKQVNSAALQFLAYMQEPSKYRFKSNTTYIAKDKYSMLKSVADAINNGEYNSIISSPGFVAVTVENQATAALYNYTPHVYNGNYNFYRLYKEYFPETTFVAIYPDSSLLKVEDDPGIWLIENGKRRLFLNWSSFISRFDPKQILITTRSAIESYPIGQSVKFPDYSLVQTPDKQIYLLVGNEKRPFESLTAFKTIGFNVEEIEPASVEELAGYRTGTTITAKTTYVTGALLQDSKTGGVYYVENGTKAPLVDRIFLTTKFKDKPITKVSPEILNTYPTVDPVKFNDGALLKSDSFPTVYLISNGEKRPFTEEAIFRNLGYKMENILTVSSKILSFYPMGTPIQEIVQ